MQNLSFLLASYSKESFALILTLLFFMFPFDPPGNIRKPFVFRGFKREHWEE